MTKISLKYAMPLGFLVFLLIGFLMMVSAKDSSDVVVKIDKYSFIIPKYNSSREGTIPNWLSKLPGLDDGSRDYLLLFSAEEIAENIPGYQTKSGDYQEDIRAILSVLTDVEIERYQDPSFGQRGEAWYGTGSFKNRRIEKSETGHYKVYREIEYPDSWVLLKKDPAIGEPIPDDPKDFWVAQCRASRSTIAGSEGHVICQANVFFGDIAIDFSVSEGNIHVIDEIGEFLRQKVLEWKVTETKGN